MLACLDRVHERPAEGRTPLAEELDRRHDGLLLLFTEVVPPAAELIGELDLPHREASIQGGHCISQP